MAPTRFALKTFRPLDVSVPRPRRFSPRGFDPRRSGHKTFRAYTFRPTDPQDVSVIDVTAPRRFGPQMFRPVDPIGILTPLPLDVPTPGRSRPWRFRPWTFQTLDVPALDLQTLDVPTLDVPDPGRSDPGRFRP